MKLVRLTFSEIRYAGASVGDDISIAISAGGERLAMKKRLSVGAVSSKPKLIGEFIAPDGPLEIPIAVTISDLDPVYDDAGRASGTFIVRPSVGSQSFSIDVRVQEAGSLVSDGAEAVFTLVLTAETIEAIRYVPESGDGFLVVLSEPERTRIALPTALKVRIDGIENHRDSFTILEGALRGKKASVKHADDRSSRLSSDNAHTSMVTAQYSQSEKVLIIPDSSESYLAADDPENPLERGIYDLEIPDAPHRGSVHYPEAIYGRTWFRIGHSGDRYLHTGSISAGCVTIRERSRWDQLYKRLITARKGDDLSVGVIRVVE